MQRYMSNTALILRAGAFLIIITLLFIPRAKAFNERENSETEALYQAIDFADHEPPPYDLFERALEGYVQLQHENKLSAKGILTLIDFRRSANEKRLWVINLKHKKLLYHSLTAHGRNSGDAFARSFSNVPNSNQSSLGFFVTGKTYIGKHGISLKLHGVEKGINDKAEARAIVMHGANYVSESYIKKYGRLGRSFGCPAVPMDLHKQIIPEIANGTCLYIYYPDPSYISSTEFINTVDES